MGTRSGRFYSPWGANGVKAQAMEPVCTRRPFHLSERLSDHLRSQQAAPGSDDLQDNPEVDVPHGSDTQHPRNGQSTSFTPTASTSSSTSCLQASSSPPSSRSHPEFLTQPGSADGAWGDASPYAFLLELIPEAPSSFRPLPFSASGDIGPQRSRKEKSALKDAKNREKRRKIRAEQAGDREREVSEHAQRRMLESPSFQVEDFSLANDAKIGSGGYTGKKQELDRVHSSIAKLEAHGLVEFVPDPGQTYALLDSDGVVTGVIGGNPQGTGWLETVNKTATQAIRQARAELTFSDKQANHRRADCPAVAFGVSFGGGPQAPGNLKQSNEAVFNTMFALLSLNCFAWISGYANALFMAYAYRCYTYSRSTLDKLFSWNPRLRRLFRNNVWAACTINFGPFSATYPHVDCANPCFNWCSVTALGNFNAVLGGHLVLWDLGLFIRFPPGSTILIPSALLVHSNVPISSNEERYSFVQYSSAGLFRWVENGFQSDVSFNKRASASERARRNAERQGKWENGLCMFSRWADIQAGNWKGT